MYPRVFIIVLNFNSKKETIECLGVLEKSRERGWEIVVVDNGSTDDSIKTVKQLRVNELRVIKNKKNLGYAGGNNVGIRWALKNGADYVLILNPDVVVRKGAIGQLLVAAKVSGAGIVGPKILTPDGKIWSAGGIIDKKRFTAGLIGVGETDRGQYRQAREVDFISGTAMLVSRKVFEEVGLLDERYFLYYEDVDFCQRVKLAGFKIVFAPKAVVVHKESTSVGKQSGLKEYYLARNHWLFLEKWAPMKVKIRELVRSPKTIWEHWRKKEFSALAGIRDYFAKKAASATSFIISGATH